MNYLTTPGAFMHEEERKLIRHLSAKVADEFGPLPCNIVHIGVDWGCSLVCSREGAPNAIIYGVDIIGFDRLKPDNAKLRAVEVRSDSREAHRDFHIPIHFIYIDGDHTYDVLSQDILNWVPKIPKGGYVAFHDCAGSHWSPEVNRAIYDKLSAKFWEGFAMVSWTRYFRRIA